MMEAFVPSTEPALEGLSQHLVHHARQLAREIDARALVVCAETLASDRGLTDLPAEVDLPVILVARSADAEVQQAQPALAWVTVPDVRMTRADQVKAALLVCLGRGVLQRGDRVVCLTGVDGSGSLDTLLVLQTVCVSQSTGAVTIFRSGKLVTVIHRPGHANRLGGR